MVITNLKDQLLIVILSSTLVWILAGCQIVQNIPPESEALTPKFATTTPMRRTATKIVPTATPTKLTTKVPPLPKMTSLATRGIEATAPTVVPTPVPWGGRLAFASQRHDTNGDGVIDQKDGVHIYSLGVETEWIEQLTSGDQRDIRPSWSPDGEQIAFISNRTGNFELFTMNHDGSDLRQLTDSSDDKTMPDWSPDGTNIAYIQIKDRGSGELERSLYLISPEENNVRQLPVGPGNIYNPSWSSDSRYLSFEREDIVQDDGIDRHVRNTYFWDTATGTLINLYLEDSILQDIDLREPKWLPRDGYYLSFFSEQNSLDTPANEVRVFRVEWEDNKPTMSEVFLIWNVTAPYAWGPNGEWFMSLVYNNIVDSELVDLERLPLDYYSQPPVSEFNAFPSIQEFVVDNLYNNGEPDWTP